MFVTKQINTLKNIILMKTKPFLSFWQIWNLTFGFLGIQFGFALQNASGCRATILILVSGSADRYDHTTYHWSLFRPNMVPFRTSASVFSGRSYLYDDCLDIDAECGIVLVTRYRDGYFISRIDWCGYVDDHGCFHQCNDGAFPCLGRGYATR